MLFVIQEKFRKEFASRIPCLRILDRSSEQRQTQRTMATTFKTLHTNTDKTNTASKYEDVILGII